MRFTDISIKALKPKTKRYDVFESGSMGFYVRITPRGVKTFGYRYSYEGKAKRLTIGRYPALSLAEANIVVGESKNMILSGIDPIAVEKKKKAEERAELTIGELIQLYIRNYVIDNAKSWAEIKYRLNHYIPDNWKDRKAKSIERWEVFILLENINNKGHGETSNMLRSYLRLMFDYAVERSIMKISPMWGIKKMHKSKARSRFLNENEIKNFWNNLSKNVNCAKSIELTLKTILATGQRPGEVRQMKTDDLDYENMIWTIPEEISKNGKSHRVPLSKLTIDLIREAYQLHKKHDYIFNSPKIDNAPIDRGTLSNVVSKYWKQALVPRFTPHDLRRTFATNCTKNGLRREWIKYTLNHSTGDVTAIYDRYNYDKEKKNILDAWANILMEIINSEDKPEAEKTNVLNFLLIKSGER